jgi:hypothetical protein
MTPSSLSLSRPCKRTDAAYIFLLVFRKHPYTHQYAYGLSNVERHVKKKCDPISKFQCDIVRQKVQIDNVS